MVTATKSNGLDIRKTGTMDDAARQQVIEMLQKSYHMEMETVCNYLANSIYLDGILAKEVKESLETDVQEELGHAQQLARRLKILGGYIPGSQKLKMEQSSLQPPQSTVDVYTVIRGVIEAEDGAIDQYQKIIEATDQVDPVTQDMCIALKADEEQHRREFAGYLRGYDAMKEMYK